MATKVGINGFGRIGRNIMRAALGSKDIDFVAVNDLTSAGTLAHLLKYDSILGNLKADITASGDKISVDGDDFQVLSTKDPAQLPWKDLGVEVVFEGTGLFTDRDSAASRRAGPFCGLDVRWSEAAAREQNGCARLMAATPSCDVF